MAPVFIFIWIWIDPFRPESSLQFKRVKEWKGLAGLVVNLSMQPLPWKLKPAEVDSRTKASSRITS